MTTCMIDTGYDWINVHLTGLIWRGSEMLTFFVFLTHTVQDTVRILGLYISMDSTVTLASFSERYLAETQDNINVLLEQTKIVT